MAFTLRPIRPKGRAVDAGRIMAGIRSALRETADGAQDDFERTTATWENRPTFEIVETPTGIVVGTDDQIYQYVDEGTRPHIIAPKAGKALRFMGGHRAKTAPRVIGSGSGGASGPVIIRRIAVQHPGTKARDFTEVISKKAENELPLAMAAAIGAAVGGE